MERTVKPIENMQKINLTSCPADNGETLFVRVNGEMQKGVRGQSLLGSKGAGGQTLSGSQGARGQKAGVKIAEKMRRSTKNKRSWLKKTRAGGFKKGSGPLQKKVWLQKTTGGS